jgi:hypothetical protein
LIEALRPFARLLGKVYEPLRDEFPVFTAGGAVVTVGDIRRAARLVEEYEALRKSVGG